jgi:hypothetical protein
LANAVGVAPAPAEVDANIEALNPAQLRQRLCERQSVTLRYRIIRKKRPVEHPDAAHPLGLLRAQRKRPRCRSGEKCDELAPFQLIELHFRARQRRIAR